MRNAIYSSFPSRFSSFGNNEIQIPSSDFSVSSSVYGSSSFFHDSQVTNDQHLGSFAPLSSIEEIPPSLNYLHLPQGSLTSTTSATTFMNEAVSQPNFSTQMKRLVNQFAEVRTFNNGRKHKTKAETIPIDSKPPVEESRKRKAIFIEDQQYRYHPMEEQLSESRRVPVKRSQKIADKITALQKLVSPFGKTDTASVLQEASAYIKLLHEQIQMLSTPYFGAGSLIQRGQGVGGMGADLRSTGLCLVPVSFTRNIMNQEAVVDRSISRRTMIPRNY